MDRHAFAPRDESDNLLALDRIAAPGAIDHDVVDPLDLNAILEPAFDVITKFSQSRDGWLCGFVRISRTSPFRSWYLSGTMRPLTLAPTQVLPTSVWIA